MMKYETIVLITVRVFWHESLTTWLPLRQVSVSSRWRHGHICCPYCFQSRRLRTIPSTVQQSHTKNAWRHKDMSHHPHQEGFHVFLTRRHEFPRRHGWDGRWSKCEVESTTRGWKVWHWCGWTTYIKVYWCKRGRDWRNWVWDFKHFPAKKALFVLL